MQGTGDFVASGINFQDLVLKQDDLFAYRLESDEWSVRETFSQYSGICYTLQYTKYLVPKTNSVFLALSTNYSLHLKFHEPGDEYWHQLDFKTGKAVRKHKYQYFDN